MNRIELSATERATLATDLRDAEWHAVAEDIEAGQSIHQVLGNLRDIGEADSSAAIILRGYME